MLSVDAELVPTTRRDNSPAMKESLKKDHKKEECLHQDQKYQFLIDEFYDAAILYCETDYNEVEELMKTLRSKITLENSEPLKIDLFDIISPSGEIFSQVEILIKKCSCLIMYLTESFLEDPSLVYRTRELLINSVTKPGTDSNRCQLTLISNTPLDLPVGMQSLCIIKWKKNQDLALRKLQRILQTAQRIRQIREKQNLQTATSDSPESFLKSNNCHIHKAAVTNNYNITATNVQLGENCKMYGTKLVSADQLISQNIGGNQNAEVKTRQQNLLSHISVEDPIDINVKDETNIEVNITGSNVGVSIPGLNPTKADPHSTSGSSKDV